MFTSLPTRLKRASRQLPLLAAALLLAPAAWAQVTIPTGNPAGTTNRRPLGNFFGFERSAAIYTAADISGSGSISSVGFYLESIAAPVAAVPTRIFLKTTTNTSFAAATTVAAEIAGATLVYDATIPVSAFTAGTWVTVALTAPFAVTATDNLEIIVEANGGGAGTEGSAAKVFRFTPAGANRFQSWQADNTAPTTTGTPAAARPNIQLTGLTPAACAAPSSLTVTNTGTAGTTANLTFTAGNGNTGYTLTYTPTGGTPVTQTVTASPVALAGLTPGTAYAVSLVGNCAAGATSSTATTSFTTSFPAPANDLCSASIALTCGQTVTGTTVGATATGDPSTTCAAGSPLTPSPSPGVFYSFAGNGQLVTVSTCSGPTATAGDTKLFVYSGSCGTLTCVGSNDDIGTTSCGTNSRASIVTFPTVTGTTYYVFVQFFSLTTATGPFGLSLICAAPVVTTYATLPVSESFEGPWLNGLGTRDLPSASWRNTPATGNASWRRDDDGASAAWIFLTPGGYTPVSSQGARSARFHSSNATAGLSGSLDLYVNMSGAAGARTLTFDYVNPTSNPTTNPADKLDVLVSTDGGATFTATPVLTATNSATFTARTVAIASTSATTVIRFRALADFGNDDIGIDNVQLRVGTATRNAALAATVALYPNPASRAFTLDVPAGSLRAASATLSNALGQVVQTRALSATGTTSFDVSGLAAGVYSLTLKAGNDLVVKRVVVE